MRFERQRKPFVRQIVRILVGIFSSMVISLPTILSCQESPGLEWRTPIQISADSVPSNLPLIGVVGDTIHIIWFGADTLGTEARDGIQYARSIDGGLSFSQAEVLLPYDVVQSNGLLAVADTMVYVAFNAYIDTFLGTFIIRSSDGGESWQQPQPLRASSSPLLLTAVGDDAYIYFLDQRSNRNGILRTTNGGVSWNVPSIGLPIFKDLVASPGRIHAVGPSGSLIDDEVGYYGSFTMGTSWFQGEILSTEDVTKSLNPKIAVSEQGLLVVVWVDTGRIITRTSRNGGVTWSSQITVAQDRGVVITDIAASGEFAAVAWDRDSSGIAGLRIRPSNTFATSYLEVVNPVTNNYSGEPSVMMRGNRLHAVWYEQTPSGQEIFYRSAIVKANPVLTPPTSFALRHNYPNPVNATTIIEFTLSQQSQIELALFDLLGRKVITVLSDERRAGRYSVELDLGGLASGVYYYRLTTPAISEVKKMLLIR